MGISSGYNGYKGHITKQGFLILDLDGDIVEYMYIYVYIYIDTHIHYLYAYLVGS